MRERFIRSVPVAVLVALFALALAPPAPAASVVTRQVVPGLTQRTIWDTSQVACYRLPDGVNHNGYIHMELTFQPAWADFDLYLLDEDLNAVSKEMGYMAVFAGREVVDHQVTTVRDTTIGPDGHMVGDPYYVVIVPFNEAARCRVQGYYPQIDLSVSDDTTSSANYYLKGFSKPIAAGTWIALDGPEYGHPYDFTPTSVGPGEVRLEWPADVVARQVTYDPVGAPSPANMESYLYAGPAWETLFADYGDLNWTPPMQEAGAWYGLRDLFLVEDGAAPARPLRALHWVPSVFLVASDETRGGLARPRLGKSTIGFRGVIEYPENLRLAGAPAKVKKGATATIKGTFALNAAWVAAAEVNVQVSVNGVWKTVKTATTDPAGRWSAKVKVTRTASYRAVAAGDPLSGLEREVSVTKRIQVR